MSTIDISIPAEILELSPYAPTRSQSRQGHSAPKNCAKQKLTGALATTSAWA